MCLGLEWRGTEPWVFDHFDLKPSHEGIHSGLRLNHDLKLFFKWVEVRISVDKRHFKDLSMSGNNLVSWYSLNDSVELYHFPVLTMDSWFAQTRYLCSCYQNSCPARDHYSSGSEAPVSNFQDTWKHSFAQKKVSHPFWYDNVSFDIVKRCFFSHAIHYFHSHFELPSVDLALKLCPYFSLLNGIDLRGPSLASHEAQYAGTCANINNEFTLTRGIQSCLVCINSYFIRAHLFMNLSLGISFEVASIGWIILILLKNRFNWCFLVL